MPDNARKKTDKELAKMEKHVNEIYSEAYDDISKSWDKFMKSHAPKLEQAQKELEEAKKSSDKDAIKDATEKYERIAKDITVNDEQYQAMVDETSAKLTHANEVALAYVNNQMPKIYTTNYNAFGDNEIDGYSFALVNENAVKELATKDKAFLPKKKVDIPKDMKWNEKNINSQMLQGILQGESIPKMAMRLMNVTDMNRKSAVRNARTMTTSAENKGRQDSFKKAEEDGVIMTREWVAYIDDRTRAWHEDLNGVEVGVDEPWENEYGPLMYPGDPEADPANVYNCRCSIRAHIKGFKASESYLEEQEEVPAEQEENETLVARDYDTDFAKNYGSDYYDDMIDLVDACENDDLKYVWQTYQSEIGAKDPNYRGRAYASVGNIHVSKNDAKGSSWDAPYAVTFHESGHAIDFLAKDLADTNGLKLMYSSAYKDGLFPATIRDEVAEMVKTKDVELKALFKEHAKDYAWLHENGFISDYSWHVYETRGQFFGGEPKYSKSFAYAAIQKEIKDIAGGGMAISDLSDMLEGATDGRIRCGYGHGVSYWKKIFGVDEKLGTEAFAEMTSATVTNKESLNVIKQYLPKSYQVYQDMIKDLAGKR